MTLCSKFNGTLSENRFGERFFPNNSKETLLLLDIFFIYKTLALPTCNLLIQQSKKINCINQPLRRNFIFLSDRGWSTGRTRVMTSVILDVCHPSSISARQLFLQPLNAAAEANSQWRSESRLQCAIASLRPHRVQGSKPTTWSRQWGSHCETDTSRVLFFETAAGSLKVFSLDKETHLGPPRTLSLNDCSPRCRTLKYGGCICLRLTSTLMKTCVFVSRFLGV